MQGWRRIEVKSDTSGIPRRVRRADERLDRLEDTRMRPYEDWGYIYLGVRRRVRRLWRITDPWLEQLP